MKKIYNDLLARLELTTDSLELILRFASSGIDAKLRQLIEERIAANIAVIERAKKP